MASIEAWGGPSGNSFPLIQTVSEGATPESLARCANAASVRPAATIPAKARRENMWCSYGLMFLRNLVQNDAGCESTGRTRGESAVDSGAPSIIWVRPRLEIRIT